MRSAGWRRGGATRGGYTSMLTYVSLGGAPYRVRIADLSIRDLLDEVPNTCQMTVFGTAPPLGGALAITVGSLNGSRLFGGKVLSTVQSYLGQKPANVAYQVNGIDYTWQATQHLVIGQYIGASVIAIVSDLIARYAEGVTMNHIGANVASLVVDAISFTNITLADALSQLCSRLGAYWNIDYYSDLHLFTAETDPVNPDPLPLTPTHPSLANLTVTQDLSQIATRVFVEGGGGTTLVDVNPGDTMIPMDTIGWYQPGGGQLHIAPQRLSYTGLWTGGTGSLVGPGVVPSTAPGVTPTTGTGVDAGSHAWAYTWVTAAGETLPSPVTVASTQGVNPPPVALTAQAPVLSAVPAPTPAPTASPPWLMGAGPPSTAVGATLVQQTTGGGYVDPGSYDYVVTFVTATGETTPGPISPPAATNALQGLIDVTNVPLGPSGVLHPNLYRRQNGTGLFKLVHAFTDNTQTGFRDGVQQINLGVAAPTVNTSGAGYMDPGTYDYVVTFVTAAGETTPGPASNAVTTDTLHTIVALTAIPTGPAGVTQRNVYRRLNQAGTFKRLGALGDNVTTALNDGSPNAALGANAPAANTTGGAYVEPGTYDYAVTFLNAAGETTPGPVSNAVITDAITNIIPLTNIPLGPAGALYRYIYRRKNGGAFGLLTGLSDNVTTAFNDTTPTASMAAPGTAPPATNTTLASRFTITVSVGTGITTQRRLYRTPTGGGQLKLLATLADNTTTAYLDALADASLGVNAPTADTSGLQQPLGTVLAGSPTLILAGMSTSFRPAGGWAIVGNGQLFVRYSGISGNSLTGIPATGPGAISTSISYGAMATAAPLLLGIPASGTGAVLYLLHAGDELDLLVTCDDVAAQIALKALTGGTGIREEYIQDRRINYTEALARGRAMLADRSTVLVEVRYTCRDPLTRSGATIVIGLPAPTNLSGSFKIQDVTIATFSGVPGQPPTYTVLASSQRYSLDDLLRIARGTVGA